MSPILDSWGLPQVSTRDKEGTASIWNSRKQGPFTAAMITCRTAGTVLLVGDAAFPYRWELIVPWHASIVQGRSSNACNFARRYLWEEWIG